MADIILHDDDPELLEIKEENARLSLFEAPAWLSHVFRVISTSCGR